MTSKKAPRRIVSRKSKVTAQHHAASPTDSGHATKLAASVPSTSRAGTEPDSDEMIEVELVREEHEALQSMGILDDRMMAVVKAARSVGSRVLLMKGDRADIDELAGWVAGECNHEAEKKGGSRRRAQLLSDACDAIEAALR